MYENEYRKSYISTSDSIQQKSSSQCSSSAQIEQVHDKMNGTDTLNLLFGPQILR